MGLTGTATLALLAGASTAVTAVFQWYLLTRLGAGLETDALFAGLAVPHVILGVLGTSVTYVLVPLLATDDEHDVRRNAWGFFLGVAGVVAALALVLHATAPYWVPWLVPGFTEAGVSLAVSLTRIHLVGMVFLAALSVEWAVYHARQRFLWIEASELLSNLIALLLLPAALAIFGIIGAALLIVLRAGAQVLWLLPGLGGWQRPAFGSEATREAWRRLRPLLVGGSYCRTDVLVDRALSSMAPAGALSLLYIGQQLYGAANTVAARAIAAPMMPLLARQASVGDWDAVRRSYRACLLRMAAFAVSGSVVVLLAGEALLDLVVGHGGITEDNVHLLWLILVGLTGSFVGGATAQVSATSLYALGDTRTPMRIGIATYTLYVPLKIAMFLRYGLIGLTVAISAFFVVNFVLQLVILERRIRTAEVAAT